MKKPLAGVCVLMSLWLVLAAFLVSPAQARPRVREFSIPTPDTSPFGIAAGPDGNLWFIEYFGNQIGRITPKGAITEFPIPSPKGNLFGIAPGPDGAMWFTEAKGTRSVGSPPRAPSPSSPLPGTR